MTSIPITLLLGAALAAVPNPPARPPESPSALAARLDELVRGDWHEAGITPAGPADDATFARRVWLTLTGHIPPEDDARAFLADRTPDKRARLVDRLLGSDEFADAWARIWSEALLAKRPVKQDGYDPRVLQAFFRQALAENRSYRAVVTELISGEGVTSESGPATFLVRYEGKPTQLAGAVSKQFLGLTIQCAQCHDHPFAHWKKDDFWGLAAYFGRLRVFRSEADGEEALMAVVESRQSELRVPDPEVKQPPMEGAEVPKKIVLPRLPGVGAAGPLLAKPSKKGPKTADNRRTTLAAWVTAPDNPYFARHAVSRVWGQVFGVPLVKTFDGPEPSSNSLNRRLLELLAADFTASGGDVKRLVRLLVLSRPFGLSSRPVAGGNAEPTAEARDRLLKHHAAFPARPLSVDQLYESVRRATNLPAVREQDLKDEKARQAAERKERIAKGEATKEDLMPPEEPEPDDGDADDAVNELGERALTVQRNLALLNGGLIQGAVDAGVRTVVKKHGEEPGETHVDALVFAALGRRPTGEEMTQMLGLVRSAEGTAGLEDLLWALLNSAEFCTLN